jgi:putative membrane protein
VESWINAHRWLTAVGAIGALLIVGTVTGIVRTALVNWDFRLSRGPRAFRRQRGLTTRTDVAIPLSRIQAAIVATGLIRRRWGWHELRVQSLASDGKDEKDHQLVPFARLATIDPILAHTGMARPAEPLEWRVPPLLAQAVPGVILTLVALVVGLAGFAVGHWQGPAGFAVAGLLVLFTAVTLGKHRWAEDDSTLYIWRGWWSPRLTILPFANVQSADLADGPLAKA